MAAQSEWSQARYAEVAVDAAVGPERTFTYAIPAECTCSPGNPSLFPCCHVALAAWCLPSPTPPKSRESAPVLEPQHPEAMLAPHQIELARWLSRETPLHPVRSRLRDAPAGLPSPSSSGTSACLLPTSFADRLMPTTRTRPHAEGPCARTCCGGGGGCLRRRCSARWGGRRCARCDGWCGRGSLWSSGSCRGRRARPAFDQHLRLAVGVEEAQRAAGDFPLTSRRLASAAAGAAGGDAGCGAGPKGVRRRHGATARRARAAGH